MILDLNGVSFTVDTESAAGDRPFDLVVGIRGKDTPDVSAPLRYEEWQALQTFLDAASSRVEERL